jgi:hypothetical protein
MRRRSAARMAVLDKPDKAFTQIKRLGLRHRESPPAGSELPTLSLESLPIQSESPML